MKNEVTMTKTDKYLLWGMVVGLSLMLILRDVSGIYINKFIYFGFAVALMAIANYQTMVYMICFILPLVCGLPGTYIMPCALALLIIKRGKIKLMQFMPLMIILLLEITAAFWYPSLDVVSIVNYVSFAGVMIFLIQDNHDDLNINYRECIKLYLVGSLVLCCVIWYATLMDATKNWMQLFAEGQFRFGEVQQEDVGMTLTLNANSLAYYSLIGIACSFLLMEKVFGGRKTWYIVAGIIFAAIGFLTLSRSWLLFATVLLLLFIMSKLRNPRQFAILFGMLLVVAYGAIVYLNKNPEFVAGFETRFEDDTVESGGNRTNIFNKYMEVFLSDFRFMFLGTGVTHGNAVAGMSVSMHNGTQQILICTGIVGFFIYIVVMFGPVVKIIHVRKAPLVYWLPLLCVVAFTQTIQFLTPTMLMLPYIIGIYALRAGGQNNENISDNSGHRGRQSLTLETR